MTIEEIESACIASRPLDFSRHALEDTELSLCEVFYPLGFPTELKTNSPEILSQAHRLWSMFEKRFNTEPIRVDVRVVEDDLVECPPAPVFRMIPPLLMSIANANNYSIANLDRCTTQIVRSRDTMKYHGYQKHFFLGSAPLCHIVTRHTTPVHAGCVARHGRGVLLCGDSGAGKSTLSYACARAGWTYVSDDASYLIRDGKERLVIGNCYQVRFRPAATELFPEVVGMEIAPHAAGKPSIEMSTASIQSILRAQTAQVDYLVFLNRRVPGPPKLVSFRKDVARYYMRQVLFGSAESLAAQYASLERLLTAEVFELRYSNLDWAVERLETLVQVGR